MFWNKYKDQIEAKDKEIAFLYGMIDTSSKGVVSSFKLNKTLEDKIDELENIISRLKAGRNISRNNIVKLKLVENGKNG